MSRKKPRKKPSLARHDAFYLAGFLVLFAGIVVIPLGLFIAALCRPSPKPPRAPGEIHECAGRITDLAKILDPDDLTRLDADLASFETATGGQMALLTIPSLAGDTIEDLATRTFNAWGVGHADRDDGVLLLLSVEDRLDRLEIGYGWESAIPDARAGDILRELVPYLRAEDYPGALALAIQRVRETVLGTEPADFPAPRKKPFDFASLLTWSNLIGFLGLLGLGLVFTAACLDPGGDGPASGGGSRRRATYHGIGGFGSGVGGIGGSSSGGFGGFGGGRSGGGGATGRW